MKSAVIILLAMCAAVVSATEPGTEIVFEEDSQLALAPSDNEEVSFLTGKEQIFSDFCLATRDYVLGDLKKTSNEMAANGFALFFKSAETMGLEAIDTQRKASETFTEQIRNPEKPVEGSDNQIIQEGQERIQQTRSIPRGVVEAIGSTLAATGSSLAQNVLNKLNQLKSVFGLMQIVGALSEACNKVSEYEEEIRRQFADTKEQVVSRDSSLGSFQVENVNCLTSKRILRVEGLCKFARIAQGPLLKMLTYRQ